VTTSRQFARKEKKLLQALEKDPLDPELFTRLGKLYFLAGKYDQASDMYSRGLQLEPENPPLLLNLGVTREAQDQPDKAKELYLKILSQDANNRSAQERLEKITSF